MSSARRRAAHGWGRSAETLAMLYLLAKGYRPLARRYAGAGGEIDLIVRRGSTIAFVEVKARGLMQDALNAVTATKRRRFSKAARAWLARYPGATGLTWRADAVFVAPWRVPQHLVAAFELEIG